MRNVRINAKNKTDIVGLIFKPSFDVIFIRPHANRAPAFLLNKIIIQRKYLSKKENIPSCCTCTITSITTIIK